jgi:hypothetical protein
MPCNEVDMFVTVYGHTCMSLEDMQPMSDSYVGWLPSHNFTTVRAVDHIFPVKQQACYRVRNSCKTTTKQLERRTKDRAVDNLRIVIVRRWLRCT